jgi:monoamine oxidase
MIASSNEPAIRWMIDQRIVSEENILTAYAMGKAAADLASMIPAEQKNWVRNEALKAFPELRGSVAELEVFPYSWDLDEFACGGYPWPAIGQDQVPNILASPEGKMHFAGEHTTHHFAWIQGAMESGLRAAKEVHEAP